jgi:hypothetical protein
MANKRGRLKGLVPIIQDPTKQASQPCKYPAGSPERIAAYRQRFERGEQLFHPSDAKTIVPPAGNGKAAQPQEIGLREIDLSKLVA